MFLAVEKVVEHDCWIFAYDGTPSHWSNLVQDFLKTKFKCCFICAEEQPLSSLDVNPLIYFYWHFVKTKVYKGRPSASEDELKKKIKSVWNICANDLVPIRKEIKQFVQQMKTAQEKQRRCIKMLLFG